ncbi:translation machinery-associated protein 16 homolog [Leptopilina boulardi]|uniref:translation machinery-associated protein 16 homolog n=1 Tax=Leptopilina boulardi TaxID=63433 RepID=UPI0021F671CA|nr:translation machinery-associated protein 16 homolog [Leptopilina boulardi]
MSTNLRKELSKVKKLSHPNSRKSIALVKKTHKINKREKTKLGSYIKQNLVAEKMLWIQQNMKDVCPYTTELTAELLLEYIARNDEELEQIALKHSIGGKRNRQHASREDILRMTKERELEEYKTCGIEIPDILTTSQCEMLKKWDGELRYLPNFKFRRFGQKDLTRDYLSRIKKNVNSKLVLKTNDISREEELLSTETKNAENAENSRIEMNKDEKSNVSTLENDSDMIVE